MVRTCPPERSRVEYASTKATSVKALGIQVLTIGFLSEYDEVCDTSGTYSNASVTKLLANMASPIKGVTAIDNSVGCTSNVENTDGDNFFCRAQGRRHQVGVPRRRRPARQPPAPHHRIDHRVDGTTRGAATACEPHSIPTGTAIVAKPRSAVLHRDLPIPDRGR